MSLNPQQRLIVETLDGSINVAAGAGTGKTFTLTQRIVNAVKDRLDTHPDDPDPSGHVLAITFTNKAASELKSRVRQAFLEASSTPDDKAESYLNCALSIDNAWISTIHGMAGRILRENAIDFGIDPSFAILTSGEESVLFSQALEKAVIDVFASDDAALVEFIEKSQIKTVFKGGESLEGQIRTLFDSISYMPSGLDGVRTCSKLEDLHQSASRLYRVSDSLIGILEKCLDEDAFGPKDAEKASVYLQEAKEAIVSLDGFLTGGTCAETPEDASCTDPGSHPIKLISVLSKFPTTTDKFGSKTDYSDEFDLYRRSLKEAFDDALSNLMVCKEALFLKFARMVQDNLSEIKSRGYSKMSQSDVLSLCNSLLSQPENEVIRKALEERFDHIMLDEFQDTDKLQMSLIDKFARHSSDPGEEDIMVNLCTVGDMQQSIYRFRGGDVELSQKRARRLAEGAGIQLELSNNYRSHADVLDTVEMIFSRDGVFGDDFLKLQAACETLDDKCDDIFSDGARIEFDFLHGGSREDKTKVNIAQVRRVAACRIARHFRDLADKGAAPRDMALLLGGMSNAEIYAKALREVGLESAITAGSLFSDMEEPALVSDLLAYAQNPNDGQVVLRLLFSDLFEVTDDDLLILCRRPGEDGARRIPLARAFASLNEEGAQDSGLGRGLVLAKNLLGDFLHDARMHSPSLALTRLFAASGLLTELEEAGDAQSLVSAGTIKKSIDLVADMERESAGISETASKFEEYRQNAKESPGTLVTSNSDFIQIMTVHSSKGLEFKHVAIAEMRDGITKLGHSRLVVENIDDETFMSFDVEGSDFASHEAVERYKKLKGFKSLANDLDVGDGDAEETLEGIKNLILQADSHSRLGGALKSYEDMQALDEARRLMYVALTRARESLYVSISLKDRPTGEYKGVFADIFHALGAHFSLSEEETCSNASFSKRPMAMHVIALATDEMTDMLESCEPVKQEEVLVEQKTRKAGLPTHVADMRRCTSTLESVNEGLYSYSMLAENAPDLEASDMPYIEYDRTTKDLPMDDERSMMAAALSDALDENRDSAVDFGTAFHRLAQASIIESRKNASNTLKVPKGCNMEALVRSLNLGDKAEDRLRDAFSLWRGSDIAKRFCAFGEMHAELPFNVVVIDESGTDEFVLYGEIDALAQNDRDGALFIDYKTGNREENDLSKIGKKYSFQAKCYAYALLSSGFKEVEGVFVLVEKPVMDANGERKGPMCIEYSFTNEDIDMLKREIIEAYKAHIQEIGRQLP